jgi:MFS family permease
MFSFVDRMILNLLIEPIRRDFQISDTEISLLIGFSFALFFAVMGLPLGRLADRVNRRGLICVGVSAWSIATAACGLASNFWALFAARIAVGSGEATLSPAAYSIITDYFPRERLGRALAVYSLGAPVGSGAALMIGGGVVNLVLGLPPLELPLIGPLQAWQLTFFCVGLPGLLVAALMLTVREPERRGRVAETQQVPIREVARFVGQRRLIFGSHLFAISMIAIVMYGAVAWIPQLFVRSYGMRVGDVGLIYGAIFMVCGVAGILVGGSVADRLFSRGFADAHFRTILISVLSMLPFMVAMPLMPTAELAFVVMVPAVFCSSLFGGSAPAALQLITPNELRGQVSAMYFLTVTIVGLGFGPTVYAAMTDYLFGDDAALRYSIALVAATVLPAAAFALSLGIRPYGRAVTSFGLTADQPA